MGPFEYAPIPGLRIEEAGPGDREGVEKMLTQITLEVETAKSAYADASERLTALGTAIREAENSRSAASAELAQARALSWRDALNNNPACDARHVAIQLLSLEQSAQLWDDTVDYGQWICLPTVQEERLVRDVELKRLLAVESALLAALSNIDTQERLQYACLFKTEGRISFVGENTTNLRAAAREAHGIANRAENDLIAFRKERESSRQQRLASGMKLTRAEAAATHEAFAANVPAAPDAVTNVPTYDAFTEALVDAVKEGK
jgi:hypothetical protein